MKSPDEIKKGLECCADGNIVCAGNCVFDDDIKLGYPDCVKLLMTNALALIQQREAELEDMTARYKIADDCAKKKGEMNEKLYAELAAVKAERDALMRYLINMGCESCLYEEFDGSEPPCINCTAERDLWQWKGVQKEDSDA